MENLSRPVLTDPSPARLAAAVEENLIAWMPLFASSGEYREDAPPGVKRSITRLQSAIFNSLAGTQLEPDQADAAIEWVLNDAAVRGIPICWWTGPITRPADMGARLEAHGFSIDDSPGMAADLEKLNEDLPIPPGLTIHRAEDEAGWRFSVESSMKNCQLDPVTDFENDPFYRCFRAAGSENLIGYTACLEGQPAAHSMMFLAAGVAGIYAVDTHPDFRRRGIGARVTLEPLLEARRRGFRFGILTSSAMGYPVYCKLGFAEVCRLPAYIWKPPAS